MKYALILSLCAVLAGCKVSQDSLTVADAIVDSPSLTEEKVSFDTTVPAVDNSSEYTFHFSSKSDASPSFECQFNSLPVTSCQSPLHIQINSDGPQILKIRIKKSDSTYGAWNSMKWTVSRVVTAPRILTRPAALTKLTTANFTFDSTTSSNNISFQCRFNSNSWSACHSPFNVVASSGNNSFLLRIADDKNNFSDVVSFAWFVDQINPSVSFQSTPSALTTSPNFTFSFSDSSSTPVDVTQFECSLNGASFSPCTSPLTGNGTANTSNQFTVRPVDAAGNIGSPLSWNWVIDNIAPVVSITSTNAGVSNLNSADFVFSGTDNITSSIRLYCSLDNATFSLCTSPLSYTALSDGSHNFQVRGADDAGNISTVLTRSWTVDRTQPVVSLISKPSAQSKVSSANFTFSGTDNEAAPLRYECSLNGATFSVCSSPYAGIGTTNATNTFAVRAIDAGGNTSLSVSYSWVIDELPASSTLFSLKLWAPSASAV